MAYDHEEQEQLDALKAWWNQYGNIITWIMIAILAGFSGWKAWGVYQSKQAVQASVLYEEVQKAVQNKDQTKVLRAVADIQDKFSTTYYAQMASMLAAKYAFDSNDVKTAKAQLNWVQEHGKTAEFKSLAKIRMAGILLDEKSYDEALKVLSGDFPVELVSMVDDRKGDIFVAQNKLDEARSAYQAALDKSTDKSPAFQLIQLKLDAIGGAKSASESANKPANKG
ncbi:putative negative regulator of RcsB-dependent stress response [Oxalobacteraceae bacterium GrIS 2.11]